MSKITLFKTAFYPLFNCYVELKHAYQDVYGRWLFYVHNKTEGIGKPEISVEGNHIASETELTQFCL